MSNRKNRGQTPFFRSFSSVGRNAASSFIRFAFVSLGERRMAPVFRAVPPITPAKRMKTDING